MTTSTGKPAEARKDFFNERAEHWMNMWYRNPDTGAYTKFDKEFMRLFSMIPIRKGDSVLDVGCGSGVLVPHILKMISQNGRLYELDYAENMIRVNRKLHPDKRIGFFTADVLNMPLEPDTCNVVICFSCFPHLDDKDDAMKAMTKVLKRGGWLAVAHFDSSDDINRLHKKSESVVMHDRLPGADEMRTLFRNVGLRIKNFIDEQGFYLVLGQRN